MREREGPTLLRELELIPRMAPELIAWSVAASAHACNYKPLSVKYEIILISSLPFIITYYVLKRKAKIPRLQINNLKLFLIQLLAQL